MPFGEAKLKSKFLKLIKSIVVGKVSWCFAEIYLLNKHQNLSIKLLLQCWFQFQNQQKTSNKDNMRHDFINTKGWRNTSNHYKNSITIMLKVTYKENAYKICNVHLLPIRCLLLCIVSYMVLYYSTYILI